METCELQLIDYLSADRAMFVNSQCLIQIKVGANPDTSGPHWYCDAVAVNFREKTIYLCEITTEKTIYALKKKIARFGWIRTIGSALRRPYGATAMSSNGQ